MTKHSPGPWIREGIQAGCHRLSSATGRVIAYFGVMGIPAGIWHVDEVDRANADLAVRAPELLDAIKRLLPYAESRAEDLMGALDHSPEGDANMKKACAAVKDAQALVQEVDPCWTPGLAPGDCRLHLGASTEGLAHDLEACDGCESLPGCFPDEGGKR